MKDIEPSEKLEVFGYFEGFTLVRSGEVTGWISDRLTDRLTHSSAPRGSP